MHFGGLLCLSPCIYICSTEETVFDCSVSIKLNLSPWGNSFILFILTEWRWDISKIGSSYIIADLWLICVKSSNLGTVYARKCANLSNIYVLKSRLFVEFKIDISEPDGINKEKFHNMSSVHYHCNTSNIEIMEVPSTQLKYIVAYYILIYYRYIFQP
jgi:hypothetical protein